MSSTNWQHEWQQSIQSVAELLQALNLDRERCGELLEAPDFPIRVPRSYLARMRRGDPDDPLLRQVLPLAAELDDHAAYREDPVADRAALVGKGILQKYQKRVLLLVTGVCAIHCRYCFRKNFPYRDNVLNHNFEEALKHVHADTSIEEVILSGGDPLSFSNARLFDLCERLEDVPHVRRIRVHTRLPICLPARLEPQLIDWLNRRPFPYVIVFHVNHPAELNEEVTRAIRKLRQPVLLNQAVLLRGVNDDAATLVRLSHVCFDAGVLPYYLHILDKVRGTAHFDVKLNTAKRLMAEVQAVLPGYLVPRLAREVPGAPSKRLF